jgi:hypothetical protein
MEVHMHVQAGAEPVDEGDGLGPQSSHHVRAKPWAKIPHSAAYAEPLTSDWDEGRGKHDPINSKNKIRLWRSDSYM